MIPAPLASLDLLYLAEGNHARTGSAWLGVVRTEDIPAMGKAFLDAGFHLEDIAGLDAAEGAVVAYHFDHFTRPGRITLLAVAPHDDPVFPSIAATYQGAEWHERETRDFFGYTFTGNPNFVPLLLADTMADVHPLHKAEGARVPLHALFTAENRGGKVVKKADGFILLDPPAPEQAPDSDARPDGGKDA